MRRSSRTRLPAGPCDRGPGAWAGLTGFGWARLVCGDSREGASSSPAPVALRAAPRFLGRLRSHFVPLRAGRSGINCDGSSAWRDTIRDGSRPRRGDTRDDSRPRRVTIHDGVTDAGWIPLRAPRPPRPAPQHPCPKICCKTRAVEPKLGHGLPKVGQRASKVGHVLFGARGSPVRGSGFGDRGSGRWGQRRAVAMRDESWWACASRMRPS